MSQLQEIEEITSEVRRCGSCGQKYSLPLDGDPTRRCPHCNVLVAEVEGTKIPATEEYRRCGSCGFRYCLPLDGDPTRRCPNCELLVSEAGGVVVA